MPKPGVMIYFAFRPSLKRLSLEEKGMLLDAMLDYGELGIQPELEGIVEVVWDFLRQKVDQDSARYTRSVQQKRYAVHVRKLAAQGLPKPDFETWLSQQQESDDPTRMQPVTGDNGCLQPVTDAAGCVQPVTDDTQTTNYKLQTTNLKPQTPYSKPHTSYLKSASPNFQLCEMLCFPYHCSVFFSSG